MKTDPDPQPSQAEPESDLPDMGEPETRGGEPGTKRRQGSVPLLPLAARQG